MSDAALREAREVLREELNCIVGLFADSPALDPHDAVVFVVDTAHPEAKELGQRVASHGVQFNAPASPDTTDPRVRRAVFALSRQLATGVLTPINADIGVEIESTPIDKVPVIVFLEMNAGFVALNLRVPTPDGLE